MTKLEKQKIAKMSKSYGRRFAIESVMVTKNVSRKGAECIVLKCEEITAEQVDITADRIIQRGLR